MMQLINHYSYKCNMKHINDLINLSDLDIYSLSWHGFVNKGLRGDSTFIAGPSLVLKTHMGQACFSTVAEGVPVL